MSALLHVIASGETDKTTFYVAGAALALWAVVISAFGLRRPSFPTSAMGSRAVMGVSGVLMVAVMVTAVATASKPTKEEGERATSPGEHTGSPRPEGQRGGTSGGPEISSPAQNRPGRAGGSTLNVSADRSGQVRFEQASLSGRAGRVTIRFSNPAQIPHDVRIERGGRDVGGTRVISGARTTASVQLSPGSYVFYCSVDGHRQAGMEGRLTVS